MVHVKCVELSHFKSFGGTTTIPLLDGFTVVSGPNGSGKSNILDGILFCLGLASSKGMRADRLPDLVNNKSAGSGKAAEAIVSVTFDVSDLALDPEAEHNPFPEDDWKVTRKLRLTKGGSYSSTYYINDQVCTATELHEQLRQLRIYPEGYNVVLQGDVTSIISMNSKERRGIIDELAGVAEFDRKIDQTRKTLDSVREREERCEIITQELQLTLEKLSAERAKAEKYQKLKAQVMARQGEQRWFKWRSQQLRQDQLAQEIRELEHQHIQTRTTIEQTKGLITNTTAELAQLNQQVKALGEDQQLALSAQLAGLKAEKEQVQRQQQDFAHQETTIGAKRTQWQQELGTYRNQLEALAAQQQSLEGQELPRLEHQWAQAKSVEQTIQEQSEAIAQASETGVNEQADLTRRIGELQKAVNPLLREQAQLTERYQQLSHTIEEKSQSLAQVQGQIVEKQQSLGVLVQELTTGEEAVQTLAMALAATERDLTLDRDTENRLSLEQREAQRKLDRLEATTQAQQEAQGTFATQIILGADLEGVHGLVAQLGQVAKPYQLALETAAGGRLGYVVVEHDGIGAAGIRLLKEKRAGRATFLPLNKIKSPNINLSNLPHRSSGFIDLAMNLVECEPRFSKIFAYVFGNTIVFEDIDAARPFLGRHRIVTLEGEVLESSGAMTGGSQSRRSALHFGTIEPQESEELRTLKRRLGELETLLVSIQRSIATKSQTVAAQADRLTQSRQQLREQQFQQQQLVKELGQWTEQQERTQGELGQHQQDLVNMEQRLNQLGQLIPPQEQELNTLQERLNNLETSQTHSEWQEVQQLLKAHQQTIHQAEQALRTAQTQLQQVMNQRDRLIEKVTLTETNLSELQQNQADLHQQGETLAAKLTAIMMDMAAIEGQLGELSDELKTAKAQRDHKEQELKQQQQHEQQQIWHLEKLQQTHQEREQSLQQLKQWLTEHNDPDLAVPENLPEDLDLGKIKGLLDHLDEEIDRGQKRLTRMEPVNMLALEEYQKTELRLNELSEQLGTLAEERTGVLLRIEKFRTLRLNAFKEAFDAVNENFKTIFATLSDGDGYLQLENEEDPFEGGLNLVAHPKGKPVQRLSSMSGGEKSLTALSFIFSLQRYRPSPFYGFDEVDMFLDGANVEKLAKMVKHQAQSAQFIVVSLRRPMIESAQRTIGVTQARGAYTQVLGIKL